MAEPFFAAEKKYLAPKNSLKRLAFDIRSAKNHRR